MEKIAMGMGGGEVRKNKKDIEKFIMEKGGEKA